MKKFRIYSRDEKFAMISGATIVLLLALGLLITGCASVFEDRVYFDEPARPAIVPAEVRFERNQPNRQNQCAIVHDRTAWLMTVHVGDCKGWIPI